MKICIINALCNHGGASINAFDIGRGMTDKGHEVKFICCGTSERYFSKDGYNVIELGQKKGNPVYHYFNPRLFLKLRKHLTKLQPDIIHIHNINLQTFSLGALLFSKKFPVVWTLHDLWPLCMTGWPEPVDCYGYQYNCRKCDSWPKPIVVINKFVKEFVFKISKFSITCPSFWMASTLKKSELGRKHTSIIQHAIDTSLFFPQTGSVEKIKLSIPEDKKVILFCGGKKLAGKLPAWRKGWKFLMDALRVLSINSPDIHLLYVGDSLELPKKFPVSVTFAEGVSRGEMRKYYAIADIFVLPSLAENSPLTLLEAMACKTAVVATSVGGIPEIVISGKTGLLCPSRDAKALSEAINFLITHPSQAESMAERAYQRVVEKFNFDLMIDRYEKLYYKTIDDADRAFK